MKSITFLSILIILLEYTYSLSSKIDLNTTPILKGMNIVGKTGLCVSARNPFGRLVQQPCGETKDLLWKEILWGKNVILVSSNGQVMDNAGSKKHNGNPVYAWSRHNGFNQQWIIIRIRKNGKYLIKNIGTGKCLDDTGKAGVGRFYHIWDCNENNVNQWFDLR